MGKSRTQKAIKNVGLGLIYELVSLICGLILPRLILFNFGSEYNGITQSITQFISYIALMKAGISGATTAALYKPLSENNNQEISEVLASTQKFMRKIALIFVIFVVCFAIIYPTFIVRDFDFLFTSSLIVIISISTFALYYFGFTYQCLLTADQKSYIISILEIITLILNTIVSVILINNNFGIHVVKLGSSIVSLITPLYLYFYVRKKYRIVKCNPTVDRLPQKWNAAIHEVASFVNDNTDVVIITIFIGLKEVSVYTVYHYVTANIKKLVTNAVTGFTAAFGNMYVKGEIDLMHENLGIFELIIYTLTTIFCSVMFVMLVPFALMYTKGIEDVSYARPAFAIVASLACAFNCYRIPYRGIVFASGHYKQTQNGAIFEAVMNILISVVAVIKFGLVGVAMGTLFAMAFRSCQYAWYLSKNIMYRNFSYFLKHVVISISTMFIVLGISKLYMVDIESWFMWVVYATISTLITIAIVVITDVVFYKSDIVNLYKKIMYNLNKKKKNG